MELYSQKMDRLKDSQLIVQKCVELGVGEIRDDQFYFNPQLDKK